MTRPCPLCEHESLRPLSVSDVEVDTCPRCHGLWFDRGELDTLLDRPSTGPYLAAQARRAEASRSVPVSCPACRQRLALVVTTAGSFDVCPRCEGVWLEAGRFEQLRGVTSLQARPVGAKAPGGAPLACSECQAGLQLRSAFAYEGDVYCATCRPPGAVQLTVRVS
ncbi:MAG TPA: zf-TFIIB domain-containing protein [Archangium sp.]|jgi:Zn-finger nucleic acid-binding protein|uniref:TFIIB-type zinc ribbon-containing protein n=1 Tax=Archangium sp. TaxID=1872627 RepID=UPI002EDB9A3B